MNMQLPKEFQQIKRIDGKGVFIEVMNSAFEIGKVQINFVEYDVSKSAGSRMKPPIQIYVDMDKFLLTAQDVLSGRMNALAKIENESTAKKQASAGERKVYANHIWLDQGGIHADKLKERGKARPDGKCLARQMKITPGSSQPWIFSAETGPGEPSPTGLIVPKYTRAEELIRVPMSDEFFKEFFIVTKAHIEAFIASQYYVRATMGMPKFETKEPTSA
jgi:hypothetical protein